MQLEGEFYQNFMEGGRTVAEFCNTEVEPMYKESDHIHIIGGLIFLECIARSFFTAATFKI